MYFNLRHVPMFSGPYMILSVDHSISPGNFDTIITGVRQPIASLPKVDAYLQSLKLNLLQTIVEKNKLETRRKDAAKINSSNVVGQSTDVTNQSTQQDSSTASDTIQLSCQPNPKYSQWVPLSYPGKNTLTYKNAITTIKTLTNDVKLQKVIFSTVYLASNDNVGLTTYENNYGGITLNQYWGNATFINGYYYCSSRNVPNASFESFSDVVTMMVNRWSQRMGSLTDDSVTQITKYWILNANTADKNKKLTPVNVYDQMSATDKSNIESKVQSAINIFNGVN
jgi:hypothetical protein